MSDKIRRALAALTNGLLDAPLDDEDAADMMANAPSPAALPGLVLLARDRAGSAECLDILLRVRDPRGLFALERLDVRRELPHLSAELHHVPRPLLTAHALERLHQRHEARFGAHGVGQLVAFVNLCLWTLSNRMLLTRWEEHPYGASIEIPVPGGAFVGTVEDEAVVLTTWISEDMLRPDQAWLRGEAGTELLRSLRAETRDIESELFGWPLRRRAVERLEPGEHGPTPVPVL